MNFSRPDVKRYCDRVGIESKQKVNSVFSIGLGGGSIVRNRDGKITVGPDSVGYRIQSESLVFGGGIPTTTDYTVAYDSNVDIGDGSLARGQISGSDIAEYKRVVKKMLERIIDAMKTSPEDLSVILVGGGAIIAPDTLEGASHVLKPKWSGIANAIGAACTYGAVFIFFFLSQTL